MGFQWRARSTSAGVVQVLWCLTLLAAVQLGAEANKEVDALIALRQALIDPAQVLINWDPSSANPCTWFHLTCDAENHVIRVDLGNALLSGFLVPQLGELSYLQFFNMYSNNISGEIPESFGYLSYLVMLSLYNNSLTGAIPACLGYLSNLEFLSLENNSLTGEIPLSLTGLDKLEVCNLSDNDLSGIIPVNGSFARFNYTSFEGNPDLHYAGTPAPGPS